MNIKNITITSLFSICCSIVNAQAIYDANGQYRGYTRTTPSGVTTIYNTQGQSIGSSQIDNGQTISICLMELIKALIRLFQHPCSQILQLTLHGKLRNQLWWKAGSGIHFCNYCDTLESLLAQSQVITGKDLIKRKEDKDKESALFQEALEFEERHRRPRTDEENWNY